MAEAIINDRRGDTWQAVIAGTNPAPAVHPKAIEALKELGITPDHAHPKHVNEFLNRPFDVVLTVCDDAAENCPIWLGQGKRVHISFSDPAKASGTDEQIQAAFRRIRDAIEHQVIDLLDSCVP
jgi:arsenate reductase